MIRQCLFFLVALALFPESLFAQEEQDAGLWTTINVEKKIHNKWSLQLTEEIRLRDNLRKLNLFYTDASVNWKAADWLRASLSYRWINKYQQDEMFSFRSRLSLDIILRKRFSRLVFSWRSRLQGEVQDFRTSPEGSRPEWYLRQRFELMYKTDSRIRPAVSWEARCQILDPRQPGSDGLWHRNRFQAGLQYEIDKRSSLGCYYLIQHEYNVAEPMQLYITGLEYSIQF